MSVTVISYTRPMSEFQTFFANGTEALEKVPAMKDCTDFWPKGTNAELLIYNDRQIVYSCCYTEAYGMLFITSVWGKNGCEYEYRLDYDAIEKSLPILSLENAKLGAFYQFAGSWIRLKRIYKIPKKYPQENDLLYRNRVTVIDQNDREHDFALI